MNEFKEKFNSSELVKVKPFVAEWFENNKEDLDSMNWKYICELCTDKQRSDSFYEWLREDDRSIGTLAFSDCTGASQFPYWFRD